MRLRRTRKGDAQGQRGEAVRDALAYQVEVGQFFGAERFVPITNAHMMGDIEVMGDGGLAVAARRSREKRARCARTDHHQRALRRLRVRRRASARTRAEVAKERELIALPARAWTSLTTDTCINYQTLYQPHLGEHVAWGDTGTVIYANSVFGARSNFEIGPGGARRGAHRPHAGVRLPSRPRTARGRFVVRLEARARRPRRLGRGRQDRRRAAPELLRGAGVHRRRRERPLADELKHLGAALASYGSMGMFHMVGVTPEAPTLEAALGGNAPADEIVIADAEIERVYAGYDLQGPELRPGRVLRAAAVAVRDEVARRAVRRPQGASRHAGLRDDLATASRARRASSATCRRSRRPA